MTDAQLDPSREAFDLEQQIKRAAVAGHVAWWELSRLLYEFHEGGHWRPLGYETLTEFLAQPDLGISRTQFFRMTKLWRDLAVERGVPARVLTSVEPSKVREVAPAIVAGDVTVEDAISDAQALGYRDLRDKYRDGVSGKLDADSEPERAKCPVCGSWTTADKLKGAEDGRSS